MATMKVSLVSVEEPIWSGDSIGVYTRTTEGEIGILPGHAPLLAELAPGYPVRIQREGASELKVEISGGFLSVRADGVSLLAEEAKLLEG